MIFSAISKGLSVVRGVKKARAIVRDIPEAKEAGENLYGQVALAMSDRQLTDQEIDQIGDAFKAFMREGRDVVQAFWPVIAWVWKKVSR
jgi:hypothetical protein